MVGAGGGAGAVLARGGKRFISGGAGFFGLLKPRFGVALGEGGRIRRQCRGRACRRPVFPARRRVLRGGRQGLRDRRSASRCGVFMSAMRRVASPARARQPSASALTARWRSSSAAMARSIMPLLGLEPRDGGAAFLAGGLAQRDVGAGGIACGKCGLDGLRVVGFLARDGEVGLDLGSAAVEIGAPFAGALDEGGDFAQSALGGADRRPARTRRRRGRRALPRRLRAIWSGWRPVRPRRTGRRRPERGAPSRWLRGD